MNGPVVPAASPASPASVRPAGRSRAELGWVLLAPLRALAFFGLSLAGAVLLVAAVGPVVLAVDGLWHVIQDIWQRSTLGAAARQDLSNALIGLACCRFVLPPGAARACAGWRIRPGSCRRDGAGWPFEASPPVPVSAAGGSAAGCLT